MHCLMTVGRAIRELSSVIFWPVAEDYDKEVLRLKVEEDKSEAEIAALPFSYWRAKCRTIIPPGKLMAPYLTAWADKWKS